MDKQKTPLVAGSYGIGIVLESDYDGEEYAPENT